MMPTDQRSLQVAEEARQRRWQGESFLRELFLGRFRLDLVHPFPVAPLERPEFRRFMERLEDFLRKEVDPEAIDASGEYPPEVVDGLRRLGAFGMKIPQEYGGLGFSQVEYGAAMKLLGSHDGNLTALLSAHQSIGVPQPLRLFGTEEQKRKYLPRCAAGAISGFALTETNAGSDPATLATTAVPTDDGEAFVLDGVKLWCTNGTLAELLVVMARNPATDRISAFVVETNWPGVRVVSRCRFMGLKALANGVIAFDAVRVPRENLIGEEGKGLKIALTTLNTGRLTLPAATAGFAKQGLEIARKWAQVRVQWGAPIGQHEAVTHQLARMASSAFAMEAVCDLAERLADRHGFDIRLEAAAAKEWNTVLGWELADALLQLRGGRGFETESSLAERGEAPVAVERALRDSRINRIFEGSSEVMHLFIAREAVDRHLQVAGALIDPGKTPREKLRALPRIALFYAGWYPRLWLGWGRWPRYRSLGPLAGHARFAERASRKLARQVFHGMMVFQARLQHRQAFLFRLVDAANELFAMTATISRADSMRKASLPEAASAVRLADAHCRESRRKVKGIFRSLWRSGDARRYRLGREVLAGQHAWLERGVMGLGMDANALKPLSVAAQLELVRREAMELAPPTRTGDSGPTFH